MPFDLRRLAVTGGAVPDVEGVQRSVNGAYGTRHGHGAVRATKKRQISNTNVVTSVARTL